MKRKSLSRLNKINKNNVKNFFFKKKKIQTLTDKRKDYISQLKFFQHKKKINTIREQNLSKYSLTFSKSYLNFKFFHFNDKKECNKNKKKVLIKNNNRIFKSLDKIKKGFYKSSIPKNKKKDLQKINLNFGLNRKRKIYLFKLKSDNGKIFNRLNNIKSAFKKSIK